MSGVAEIVLGETCRWYHGTRAVLRPGERLVPGSALGRSNYEAGWNDDSVWLTTVLSEAWEWADACQGDATPVVYEVHPDGEPEDWAALNGWEDDEKQYDEWIIPAARVLCTVQPGGPR